MASLSESSIVIALRDWQWQRAVVHGEYPKPCVGLSGNAEYKLGDSMLQVGERIFLFEIKSKHTKIREEWSKEKPKLAYQKITNLTGGFVSRSTHNFSNADKSLLHQSLQCHHFVYWAPEPKKKAAATVCASGDLYFTPYMFGIKDRCKKMIWRLINQSWKGEYLLALSHGNAAGDPVDAIRYEAFKALPMNRIDSNDGCLIFDAETTSPHWDLLGLPLPDFQKYVDHLCGGINEAEEIEVVVMSSGGSYFAYLTSTSDLAAIFQPAVATPTNEEEQKTTESGAATHPSSPRPEASTLPIALALPANLGLIPPRPRRR